MDNNKFLKEFNSLKPIIKGHYDRIIKEMAMKMTHPNFNKYIYGNGPKDEVRAEIIRAAKKVRQEIINETELTNV